MSALLSSKVLILLLVKQIELMDDGIALTETSELTVSANKKSIDSLSVIRFMAMYAFAA